MSEEHSDRLRLDADPSAWEVPNEFVMDRALGVIHEQAKRMAQLLEEVGRHVSEIVALDANEALRHVIADLDMVASGEQDVDLRQRLSEYGGDYAMLTNISNLQAACFHTLGALATLDPRSPVLAAAWKRDGNPR